MNPAQHLSNAAPEGEPVSRSRFTLKDTVRAGVAVAAAALTAVAFINTPEFVQKHGREISPDPMYARFTCELDALLIGAFVVSFALLPSMMKTIAFCRRRWRQECSYLALIAICSGMWAFVLYFGRSQFGAYDFNVLVEMGWRQIAGQRMYVDFITPTPPGFNLGIFYAYKFFGVSWDAGLYLAAIVTCVSFLWMYWLLVKMSLSRLAAMGVALAIETCTMLLLCFWWYNNSALLFASIFLLSCMMCVMRESWIPAEVSYFASLTLLSLMKPNIAGVTIIGGLVLLWISSHHRWRVAAWTIAAALTSLAILAVNHVSVRALLATYHAASLERGISSTFGLDQMSREDRGLAILWAFAFSIPMIFILPKIWKQMQAGEWRGVAYNLFFPLSLFISLYGIATNGEFREVEWAVLLASSGVIAFGTHLTRPFGRRIYVAMVFAAMVGDVYQGIERVRVYGIGVHLFFEWQDDQHEQRVNSDGFLKNMRVSPSMITVEHQVKQANETNAGPFFFGPRLDFNYAVLEIESPRGLPAWWHPGTSFARADEPGLVRLWEDHRFETLIFLKGDYTYYPPDLLAAIDRDYVRDDQYSSITVYRRRHTA